MLANSCNSIPCSWTKHWPETAPLGKNNEPESSTCISCTPHNAMPSDFPLSVQGALSMWTAAYTSTFRKFKFSLFMLFPISGNISKFTTRLSHGDSHMVQSLRSECGAGLPPLSPLTAESNAKHHPSMPAISTHYRAHWICQSNRCTVATHT